MDEIKKMAAGHSIEVLDAMMTEVEEARGEYDSLGERLDEMSSGTPTPSTAAPAMNGTASPGMSEEYARADHVHPSDTSRASAASEAEDRAALVELVDGGAKNVLQVDEIGVSATHGQTYSISGVTFTLNSDGSITATRNETSTSNADCNLRFNGDNFYVDDFCNGKFVLSGCPVGGGASTYFIRANRDSYAMADYGEGVLLEQTSVQNIFVTMRVTKDFTGTVTFKPMICTKAAWGISHAHQPYRPSYQELYEMVKALQANQ